jgi:DNA-binding transcriptional LysR family regulator
MRPIDLSKLRLFYEIAREGNMTRAAEKLNTVQPAVSRSLLMLEDRMKTKLFDRTSGGMRLTQQGEKLYIHAKKLLEEHDAFERQFYEKEDEIEGEIKVITTPFVGSEWLVPSLKGFFDLHPKITLKTLLRSEGIDLTEGDVAILTALPQQHHLIQQYLFTVQVRLFASSEYLNKFGIPQNLEDLDHHHLITYRGNYYSPYGSTNWLLNLGETSKKSYFEIDSLHGMLNGALEGLGIVEFPDYSVVLKSGLVEVLPDIKGPETSIYFIYPKSRKNSKKINGLLDYLSKQGK